MVYCRITAFVIVREQDVPEVTEALLSLIDSFVIKNVLVFDSDVSAPLCVEVSNAEEIRSEMSADSIQT
jgi:hypothetical protein